MPAICGTNTGAHSEWRFNHCCFAIFNAIYNDIELCDQFQQIFSVYIDMGLSSNSPVVLTVVTSGQSFARSFSVKVGRSLCICVCFWICVCIFSLYLSFLLCKIIFGQGGKPDLTRSSVKDYLSIDPTNYTSSTKTLTSLDRSIDSIFEHNLS